MLPKKTLTIDIAQTKNVKTESNGKDVLIGTNANNKIDGLAGDDTINGLGGKDSLTGGLGKDLLTGGTGKDIFVFNASAESKIGAKKDLITDFSHKQGDKIDLSGIDAKIGTSIDDSFTFIKSSAFHKVAGELHLVKGVLSGDTNGDGKADFEMQIVGVQKLVPVDFVL